MADPEQFREWFTIGLDAKGVPIEMVLRDMTAAQVLDALTLRIDGPLEPRSFRAVRTRTRRTCCWRARRRQRPRGCGRRCVRTSRTRIFSTAWGLARACAGTGGAGGPP
jgi:hypothetical protein